MDSAKQVFLDVLDREFATTMRVLRAYPADRLDLRPHEKCKTARELGWVFVSERLFGTVVYNDGFEEMMSGGGASTPEPPESWDEILATLEKAQADFRALVEATPDEELQANVRFLTGPNTMGEISRMDWLWFLLHDEIHHRGQFSIYLRMADGRVPSIYGPTADEPWM
ncbi:MAG: DinB family protein [Gemmatimonadota bacterium]